jgi:redox-sensing transcriptional repressor
MGQELRNIPQASAKRLPIYHRYLQSIHSAGQKKVSSSEISQAVNVDPATIRRDFSYFKIEGRKGYGYDVQYLLDYLRKTLEQDTVTPVALIGVGNLGTAFLHYNFMKNNNTMIEVAFDTLEEKIGSEVGTVSVFDMDELEEKLKEKGIEVVILTVPAQVAQSITDRLMAANVKGILNFTPIRIHVKPDVRVHHIDLAAELQSLAYFLKNYPVMDTEASQDEEKW